jgi:rfaE bifunctional protein kinase chain/domain
MSREQLLEIVDQFDRLNIIVIGDIMLDKYIWGKVNRISPEAPVPVVNIEKTEYRVGGAGNVASNLSKLKCHTSILTITGDDHNSEILATRLKKHNVQALFERDHSRSTTVKSRILAQRQQLVRMDQEKTSPFPDSRTNKLLSLLNSNTHQLDAIILSDYDKGLLTAAFIKKIISTYQEIPVIIDPKARDYARYKGATVIKPNYNEFCDAINKDNLPLNKFDQYAQKLVTDYDFKGLIVTLGERGVYYYDKGNSQIIPTEAHEVYDVSGAGDTFTAAFTASYVISNDFDLSARIGNLASAVAVEKVGTAAVTRKELLAKI